MKTKKLLLILGIFACVGLLATLIHASYMKATSYECSQNIPLRKLGKKPDFVSEKEFEGVSEKYSKEYGKKADNYKTIKNKFSKSLV